MWVEGEGQFQWGAHRNKEQRLWEEQYVNWRFLTTGSMGTGEGVLGWLGEWEKEVEFNK